MSEQRNCGNCQFWQRRMAGIGECSKQGTLPALFWVTDHEAVLLTQQSFGCCQYEQQAVAKDDVL